MTVKRYDMSGFGDGMVEREDGAFYYMDDYHALQSLNAELLEALELILISAKENKPAKYWLDGARAVIAKARSQA